MAVGDCEMEQSRSGWADYGSEGGEICVENKVRVLYNNNTFKKKADGHGNAMECHKDRDHMYDNEIVPTKAW